MDSRIFSAVFFVLLAVDASSFPGVVVSKNLSVFVLSEGQVVEVTLSVVNIGNESLAGVLIDSVPPYLVSSESGRREGFLETKRFEPVKIPGGEGKNFHYRLTVPQVPEALKGRTFFLGPAAFTDQYGVVNPSNTVQFWFDGKTRFACDFNFVCNYSKGENYAACPQDCVSGGRDEYCDRLLDGVCDPDCTNTSDPDCQVNSSGRCGNGVCEPPESPVNCPLDCAITSSSSTTTLSGIQAYVSETGMFSVILYASAPVFLVLVLILILKSRAMQKQRLLREREIRERRIVEELKGRLRDGEDRSKLVEEGFDARLVGEAVKDLWRK